MGGRWRRTPLAVGDLSGLRPTPERIRETVYDWLGHLFGSFEGRRALDLFAGSGALGLEGVSRGMAHADLVELDRRQAARLNESVSRLGAAEAVSVHACDGIAFLDRAGGAYDLILIDPPFALGLQDKALERVLGRLAPDGVVYVERSGERTSDELLARLGLVRLRAGSAGQVCCELLARAKSALAPLAREERLTRRETRVAAAQARRAAREADGADEARGEQA